MNVLIVFAHPEPRSLNAALRDVAIAELKARVHEVQVSDLYPINHGILHYPGYDVLPPFATYRTDRLDEAGFTWAAESLRERMRTVEITDPIPFRRQNGGDYLIPTLELRPALGVPGVTSFALHRHEINVLGGNTAMASR
ncbi:NAD(P)H-dependent oxidoreductase [Pseudochelatococcus sp. B33]